MADAPKKGRLSLYEDLLSAETIADMKAKDAAAVARADEAKKKSNASLMFKPTNLGKKPGAKQSATKPKATFASMHKSSSSTSSSTVISAPPTVNTVSSPPTQNHQSTSTPSHAPQDQVNAGQKRGFNDWLADEDEEWHYYERPKLERGGRKKKKKHKDKQAEERTWSWDDIYDPTVPVMFQQYSRSDVQFDINDAWKQRLHTAHKRELQRRSRDQKAQSIGDDELSLTRSTRHMNFAPPGNLNFAPPTDHSPERLSRAEPGQLLRQESDPPHPHSKSAEPSHILSEGGASAGRVGVGGLAPPQPGFTPEHSAQYTSTSHFPASQAHSLPLTTPAKPQTDEAAEKSAKAAAQIAALKAKMAAIKPGGSTSLSAAPQPPSVAMVSSPPAPAVPSQSVPAGTISAAPTFSTDYLARKAEMEAAGDEDRQHQGDSPADLDAPRSNRPGQAGFAERMLKKMGWEKGQGLGASGDGITTAIFAKAEKRKKKSDAVGGGFATPANMGKIVGGKKKAPHEAPVEGDGVYGNMSEVIKLQGMLKNLDVDHEIQENNLLQEIGDEVGEFGTVERLFIWREHMGGTNDVFIKFTSQLSALRAVKAMDGEEFADNTIKATFWDLEKFAREEYV